MFISPQAEPHVILVDEQDRQQGICEKLYAHKIGALHRAVSVYLICGEKIFLQKRSHRKYHSGGLWTNAACTHPYVGESNVVAANRALQDELGICTPLDYLGFFIYKAQTEFLTEYELDHVFLGEIQTDFDCVLNPDEVEEIRFISHDQLKQELKKKHEQFTPWFSYVFEYVMSKQF